MDTEIIITPDNLEAEAEIIWQAVCQILGLDPQCIKKPIIKPATDRELEEFLDAQTAALGPDCRTIFLSSESEVYRGHLAHEMAHYLRWHLAGYEDSGWWPQKVDEEIGRI